MKDFDRPQHMSVTEAAALICKILEWPMHIVRDHAPIIGREVAGAPGVSETLVLRIPGEHSEYKAEVLGTYAAWELPQVSSMGRRIRSEPKRADVAVVLRYFVSQTDGVVMQEGPHLFNLRHALYRARRKYPYVFA